MRLSWVAQASRTLIPTGIWLQGGLPQLLEAIPAVFLTFAWAFDLTWSQNGLGTGPAWAWEEGQKSWAEASFAHFL